MLLLGERSNRKVHQQYQRKHAAVSGKKRICTPSRIWYSVTFVIGSICFVWYTVVLSGMKNLQPDHENPSAHDRKQTAPLAEPKQQQDKLPPVDTPFTKEEKALEKITLQFWKDFGCPENELPAYTFEYTSSQTPELSLCKVPSGLDFRSVKLIGSAFEADAFGSCEGSRGYHGTLMAVDGCVDIRSYPKVKTFQFVPSSMQTKQIPDLELKEQLRKQGKEGLTARYRFVFSSESSEYFGYQTLANYYGFLHSQQSAATWTRLLTCRERDDLSDIGFTTFQSKRHLFSRRYSPINKADAIHKWFSSPDAPTEEVIVVIDPDNWLLKDVTPWVDQVSPGKALGEAAYYSGSTRVQKLWRLLCKKNCDWALDLVGVPYVVHRDDLAAIAPLWRDYSIAVKDLFDRHHTPDKYKSYLDEFGSLGAEWAAEMFGYNMAAAHAGVQHKVVSKMQVRDVDGERRTSVLEPKVSMIHMGRAWFPHDYEPGKQWAHTEGKSFRRYGQQVWCKCNYTASTVVPWPVPEGADFVSTKTLTILHNALEELGPVPVNQKFRKGTLDQKRYYHHAED